MTVWPSLAARWDGRQLARWIYSIGLGIPFLLTSLLLAKAFSAFNWVKRYLTQITVVSGLLLAFFGVLSPPTGLAGFSLFVYLLVLRLLLYTAATNENAVRHPTLQIDWQRLKQLRAGSQVLPV